MSYPSFRANKAANELRQCELRGCGLPRTGLNRWCAGCAKKAASYGHPKARPLKPAQWAAERQAVHALLEANADHPGLQYVLDLLGSWLDRACANEQAFRGAEEIARLARHGVKVRTILIEACACWAWLQRNPHVLPDDRSRDFALSRAVFQLAPRPRRQTRGSGGSWPISAEVPASRSYSPKARPSALAHVGANLRQTLSLFFANVAQSLDMQAQRESAQQAAFRAPLWLPVCP